MSMQKMKWPAVVVLILVVYNIAFIYRWCHDIISYPSSSSFANNITNQEKNKFGWNQTTRQRSDKIDLSLSFDDKPRKRNEHDNDNWSDVIDAALASNYSCGYHNHPTSINATISSDDVNVTLHRNRQDKELSYVALEVTFRAYNDDMQKPQIFGGDVFILDYQSYWQASKRSTNNYTVVQTATYAIDRLDGTYHATLHLPREIMTNQQHVRVSLRHY